MKNRVYLTLVKFALSLHNFSYKLSTKLAIRGEGGSHPKHRLTNYHTFFVHNVHEDDEVLDIGCGNGALTFDLCKKAKHVVGIDIDEERIKVAKNKYGSKNIEYRIGDASKDFDGQRFDVIVLSNVLEHLENRDAFLEKTKELAPKLLIRVPMINRDWITLYKKEQGIEWRLDQTHFTEYTLESLTEELEGAGLYLEKYSIQFGEIWAIVR